MSKAIGFGQAKLLSAINHKIEVVANYGIFASLVKSPDDWNAKIANHRPCHSPSPGGEGRDEGELFSGEAAN